MKLHLALLFLSLSSPFMLFGQNTIGVTDFQPDLVDEGYTLVYPHNQPNVYLLDMCGEVVHTWSNPDDIRPGNVAYLQENGDIVLTYRPQIFANDPIWAGGGGATVERRTWDNDVLWSYTLNDSTGRLHHDIDVKDDGNVFAIAWEHFSAEEALAAGRDSSLVPDDGLWSEMILELAPDGSGGANVVWDWHAWDHLVQDLDSTLNNFGVVSENPRKIDINYGSPSNQPSDWLHINAIDFNPFFGHLLLSVPTFDELWIVDYNNNNSGEMLWRWGNPEAYDMGDVEDKQLFYQHDSHWVYDHVTLANPDFGKIAVFNNRVPGENGEAYSAVHLLNPSYTDYDNNYATSFENNTYLPASFGWSYTAADSIYSSGLSSFQRLENGNSLICYGRWGDTREITPDGQLAWRYKTPLVNAGGFASPVAQGSEPTINQNLTFRAHRYPTDFAAFASADLTPQGVLELNPSPVVACGGIGGCTDDMACNYDSTATIDDASCIYPGDDCDDMDANTINDQYDAMCSCVGELIVLGCTDTAACNYDSAANLDDDSCLYLDALNECGGDCLSDEDGDGICDELAIEGCTDPLACNYDEDANSDDGSCLGSGDACDDMDDMTFDDIVNDSCACMGTLIVLGCLDSAACNYDMDANTDSGMCELPGDECDDDDVNTINDTLGVDCICVGVDTTTGDTTFVFEFERLEFGMFPNPTTGEVTLRVDGFHAGVTMQVMDGTGRVVWSEQNLALQGNTVFDLSRLSAGTYNVMLSDERGISVKRLAIQK